MVDQALFYLHRHCRHESELGTSTFRSLVDRSDAVFLEVACEDQDRVRKAEENYNFCVRANSLEKLEEGFHIKDVTVLRMTRGSSRKIVLERSLPPTDFDHETRYAQLSSSFYGEVIEDAFRTQEACLVDLIRYHNSREDKVAEQICDIDGKVVVLFGAYHRRLPTLVSAERAVESHFPFENYPISYMLQLWDKFRDDDKFDEELAVRAMGESFIEAAIKDGHARWRGNPVRVLAHHYAGLMDKRQLIEFRDFYLRANDAARSRYRNAGIGDRFFGVSRIEVLRGFFGEQGIVTPDLLPKAELSRILVGSK
jgi:hypothetical protein